MRKSKKIEKKFRVLVIGDPMLDIYHVGKIERISPEAPIPVFEETDIEFYPGGAANLSMNLNGLGIEVVMMIPTIYPCDNLIKFCEIMDKNNIRFYFGHNSINLIEKHRFIDHRNHHQIGFRLDNDLRVIKAPLDKEDFEKYSLYISEFDAVVFSDYNKGSLSDKIFIEELIKKTYKYQIPTFLDSRSQDVSKFCGVKFFKPNQKEYDVYDKFINSCKVPFPFTHILRTESEKGMTFFENSIYEVIHVDSLAKNVVDPTGAGDTAMAGLVYGILNGMNYTETTILANSLASITCGHKGTYTITKEDLGGVLFSIEDKKTHLCPNGHKMVKYAADCDYECIGK